VVLSRPCTSIPWGITLSLFDGRMLLVGSVACESSSNNNKSTQPQHGQIRQHSSAGLCRGDCVLAVNGRPVQAFGGTTPAAATGGGRSTTTTASLLNNVTTYMRHCVTLHLAVWRVHPRHTNKAATATTTTVFADRCNNTNPSHVGPHKAAHWHVWQRQQQQSPRSPLSYQVYPPPTGTSSVGRVPPVSLFPYGYGMPPPQPYYIPSATTIIMPGSTTYMKPVVAPPAAPRSITTGQHPFPAVGSMPVTAPKCLLWADPYTNPLFRDASGQPIPYDDNWEPNDPDEGHRWRLFVAPVGPFHKWLSRRKAAWRCTWDATRPVLHLLPDSSTDDENASFVAGADIEDDRRSSAVPIDFWSQQGYGSWDEWLRASKPKWSRKYSWNQRKRKHFEIDARVSLDEDVGAWLQVRKRQWLMSRRKRLRQRQQQEVEEQRGGSISVSVDAPSALCGDADPSSTCTKPPPFATVMIPAATTYHNPDILLIDELLEEEERRRKALEDRPPLDLSFLFQEGACPDDAVVDVMGYLDPKEHGKLLCIRKQWRQALIQREGVWRDLCPKRWTLPRRPRKPWHELYLSNLRRDKESSQKLWDDLLSNLSKILAKGDYVQQVEKLVDEAERSFGFHINYSSGVVCERNAILNLAVIQKRHKIARWLVEVKRADIETFDRGHFTPLLNAAWVRTCFDERKTSAWARRIPHSLHQLYF
jgi:hypothetical protein